MPVPDRPRLSRALVGLTGVVALVHALAAALQPVWAGLYLSARYEMLGVHYLGANATYYAAVAQLVLALASWAATRRRAWFAAASAALVAAETVQFVAGTDGDLAVHVPLGVAVVAGAVATATAYWTGERTAPAEVSA